MADLPLHALLYDPVMGLLDRAGLARYRRRLLSEARGRVLEVGAGTGRNLPLYAGVESVVALEPDGAMRRRLLERMDTASVPVEVHEAGIDDSGLPEGSFDTVVTTLVLCTVPDQDSALAEIRRLLKPQGRLLFLEHVRTPGAVGRLQEMATPLWSRLTAGCHLDRPTLEAMRRAGLAITDCERRGVLAHGQARLSHRLAGARA